MVIVGPDPGRPDAYIKLVDCDFVAQYLKQLA